MPTTDRQMQKFLSFALGVNNVDPEHELKKGELRSAKNVDLNPAGKPRLRKGRTKVYTGTGKVHSLWDGAGRTFFVDDGNLYSLSANYELSLLRSGLSKDLPVSYEEVAGVVYYSNDMVSGQITPSGEPAYWGMECPSSQPNLSALGYGGMDAGDYQVAVTFVSQSGEESGTLRAAKITLKSVGGIMMSGFSAPLRPDIDRVRIYVTAANGSSLYLRTQIAAGVDSYALNSIVTEGKRLETQFLFSMPPGHIVRHYRGHMFVAAGSTLYYSPPWRFGLNDPFSGVFRFPERIKIMQPAKEGIFVGADRLYFLAGRTPEQMEQKNVDQMNCVEGTGLRVPTTMFGEDSGGDVRSYPCWFCYPHGWVVGLSDGTIKMLMKDRVATPSYEVGAALFREQEGIRQLIGAMRGGGAADKFGARDEITGTIIRNGIVVE